MKIKTKKGLIEASTNNEVRNMEMAIRHGGNFLPNRLFKKTVSMRERELYMRLRRMTYTNNDKNSWNYGYSVFITKKELEQELGWNYRVVTKTLKELEAHNLIYVEEQRPLHIIMRNPRDWRI